MIAKRLAVLAAVSTMIASCTTYQADSGAVATCSRPALRSSWSRSVLSP